MLDGVVLIPKAHVCGLGVLSDPGLLLNVQVAVVARSAYYYLWLVGQLCPFFHKKDMAMVTHALIISKLSYCK